MGTHWGKMRSNILVICSPKMLIVTSSRKNSTHESNLTEFKRPKIQPLQNCHALLRYLAHYHSSALLRFPLKCNFLPLNIGKFSQGLCPQTPIFPEKSFRVGEKNKVCKIYALRVQHKCWLHQQSNQNMFIFLRGSIITHFYSMCLVLEFSIFKASLFSQSHTDVIGLFQCLCHYARKNARQTILLTTFTRRESYHAKFNPKFMLLFETCIFSLFYILH